MIRNDRELAAAQGQIAQLQKVLLESRDSLPAEDFKLLARSSRLIVERLQRQILDYLTKPAQAQLMELR